MKYSSAKSDFIKNKIKETKFKDRGYIRDLLFLEKSITEGIQGFAGNMKLSCLKDKYFEEYVGIYQELDSEGCKVFLSNVEKANLEAKVEENKRKINLEQEKNDWINAGGKI